MVGLTSGRRLAQGYLALGIAQAAIGAAGVFARYALGGTGPVTASALRLALAAVPVVLVAAIVGRRGKNAAREPVIERKLVAAGLLLAFHFATWIGSLAFTSVAIATLLVCTAPLWLAIYDLVVHRRTIRAAPIAFGIAAIGLVLVVGIPAHARATDVLGEALALVGSLAIAGYLVLVRDCGSYTTLAVITRTYGYAAIALVLAALVARQAPPPLANTSAWAGIAAMAFVSQLIGHTGLNIAVRRISAVLVAMTTLLEPVVAAVLAALLLHEALSAFAIAGGMLVIAGIVVLVWGEQMNERPFPRTPERA